MGTSSIAGARSDRAAGECPLDGGRGKESNLPGDDWRHLLERMTRLDPAERPTMNELAFVLTDLLDLA